VPFSTEMPVAVEDRFYPGPFSHPYPSAQNCRTDPALAGDVRIGGVPSCESVSSGIGALFGLAGVDAPPVPDVAGANPGLSAAQLGPFLPDNVSAPSYTVLQEDVSVHLQAIRLGDILFTVCSCEQWADQSRNIKTRTNERQGDEYVGYDWSKPQPGEGGDGRHEGCRQNGDGSYSPDGTGTGTWTCPNPNANPTKPDAAPVLDKVGDAAYRRMVAQVQNPADGWNDLENFATAESEPSDPREIRGNYSRGELPPSKGYRLTVPIGMANDYNGYIATYREYQRGDHYRKALTAWGPHASDYMASRLVTLAGLLKDPSHPLPRDQEQEKMLQPKTDADLRNNDARATAFGEIGDRSAAAYEQALLRDDGGRAEVVAEPEDIRRFSTAFFTFNGGNNFVDNPVVKVQREVDGRWVDYADQTGEVQTTLKFPQGPEVASYLQGSFRWEWTAHFEAFISGFDTGDRPRATPVGRYRFVADGRRRRAASRSRTTSSRAPFECSRGTGITVPRDHRAPRREREPVGGADEDARGPRVVEREPRGRARRRRAAPRGRAGARGAEGQRVPRREEGRGDRRRGRSGRSTTPTATSRRPRSSPPSARCAATRRAQRPVAVRVVLPAVQLPPVARRGPGVVRRDDRRAARR
jgi:hypothetical protein